MDDNDLPDPTYGYFLVYETPPPDVRNLPDARTATQAIRDAREAARDCVTTIHLRHHTEAGTVTLGTAAPDGTFVETPALSSADPHPPTFCLDGDLRNLPVTLSANGRREAVFTSSPTQILPAAPLPFGVGSGGQFGCHDEQ